jgi:hypothetical protein
MWWSRSIKFWTLFFLAGFFVFSGPLPSVWAGFGLNGRVPPVLSISDSTGSFTLYFDSFQKGSHSTVEVVTYRIQANNMAQGKVRGAVSVKVSPALPKKSGLILEGDVQGYQNLGKKKFAELEESKKGYRMIDKKETSLADKKKGQGSGDLCLDGELRIAWRSSLTRHAPAGKREVSLIVTLIDGH